MKVWWFRKKREKRKREREQPEGTAWVIKRICWSLEPGA
jgi:hypothetical protein